MIVAISILYTNKLARQLAHEEEKHIKMWAKANAESIKATKNGNVDGFALEVLFANTTIPVIVTNEKGKIVNQKNFGEKDLKRDSTYFYRQLENLKNKGYEPIIIEFYKLFEDKPEQALSESDKEWKNYIYYTDSAQLTQLKWYPYIQLGITGAFILAAYVGFSTIRRAEQNKVWLGMAKETAHQLGTPLSSLVGWAELLKSDESSETARMVGEEIDKDINRLKLTADRFSKIGSGPKLSKANIMDDLENTVNYVKRRAASRIQFHFTKSNIPVYANINPTLFDWVVENLLKNALDAMENEGSISVEVNEENQKILIDISDTGHGIPKSKFNTIFEPGFSTKKRGWGLGLSLSKRIINNYHRGKIFVLNSQPDKGTTFRIILPKVQ